MKHFSILKIKAFGLFFLWIFGLWLIFFFCCELWATNNACPPTDTPRSRQQRRERQRSFLKEQELERARQRVCDRYHDDRASVASTSSTGSCDSNSHPVEIESKYSSLSSLSDVETNDHARGKSVAVVDRVDLVDLFCRARHSSCKTKKYHHLLRTLCSIVSTWKFLCTNFLFKSQWSLPSS